MIGLNSALFLEARRQLTETRGRLGDFFFYLALRRTTFPFLCNHLAWSFVLLYDSDPRVELYRQITKTGTASDVTADSKTRDSMSHDYFDWIRS